METAAVKIDPSLFTLIIQFEVDAGSGAAFARELTEAVGKSIVKLAGFRTSVFQLSSDHTRVINYAQWESKEIYERSMADLEPKDNPVIPVMIRHGARVVHSEPYSIVATFSTTD